MAVVSISSNIASLKAQSKLARSNDTLSRSFERLASGMRINRVSDDAAGLAIAASLNADARVFGQAVRNVNGDGLVNLVGMATGTSYVLLGDGEGNFSHHTSFTTSDSSWPFGITLADMNNDGVLDFIGGDSVEVGLGNTQQLTSLERINLLSQSSSRSALDILDFYLDRIGQEKGNIGSSISRLLSAVNTLKAARENFYAAESRIKDVDVAKESAELIRAQILQEAGAAVLAQTNQMPLIALSLLKNN